MSSAITLEWATILPKAMMEPAKKVRVHALEKVSWAIKMWQVRKIRLNDGQPAPVQILNVIMPIKTGKTA